MADSSKASESQAGASETWTNLPPPPPPYGAAPVGSNPAKLNPPLLCIAHSRPSWRPTPSTSSASPFSRPSRSVAATTRTTSSSPSRCTRELSLARLLEPGRVRSCTAASTTSKRARFSQLGASSRPARGSTSPSTRARPSYYRRYTTAPMPRRTTWQLRSCGL